MRCFFLLLILIQTIKVSSQFEEGVTLDADFGRLIVNDLDPVKVYGGELNWFLTGRTSVDYNLSFGKHYSHIPASVPLAINLISYLDENNEDNEEEEVDSLDGSSKWAGLIALLIPEGVTTHFKLGRKTYISPSIKPLGFESIGYNNEEEKGWYWSNNLGLKFEQFLNKNWFVSVYGNLKTTIQKGGVSKEERDKRRGYSFGLKIGRFIHRN